jgi:hypothetical protein
VALIDVLDVMVEKTLPIASMYNQILVLQFVPNHLTD